MFLTSALRALELTSLREKQAARKEEQITSQTADEIRVIKREEEGKVINLRHDNAELRMHLNQLEESVVSNGTLVP